MKLLTLMLIGVLIGASSLCASASEAGLSRLYLGAAAGPTDLRENRIVFNSPFVIPVNYRLDRQATGWKVTFGVRPVQFFAIEAEYVDFGRTHVTGNFEGLPLVANAQFRGPGAFAVGFLPLGIPRISVYGRLGIMSLLSQVNATNVGSYICAPGEGCPNIAWVPGTFREDHTVTSLAYGAGLEFGISAWSVRVEYERVDRFGGGPQMASLGIYRNF